MNYFANVDHGRVSIESSRSPRSIACISAELNDYENLTCSLSEITITADTEEFEQHLKSKYGFDVVIGDENKIDGVSSDSNVIVSTIHNMLWDNYCLEN